jgi:hypothetical protein
MYRYNMTTALFTVYCVLQNGCPCKVETRLGHYSQWWSLYAIREHPELWIVYCVHAVLGMGTLHTCKSNPLISKVLSQLREFGTLLLITFPDAVNPL